MSHVDLKTDQCRPQGLQFHQMLMSPCQIKTMQFSMLLNNSTHVALFDCRSGHIM